MHTPKPPLRLPGAAALVSRRAQRRARSWLVVVVVAVVAGVRLVVARRPDPLEAVPAPAAGDPVVAGDRVVVLEDHRRAPVVVVVAMVDHRARDVDRTANDVAIARLAAH